MNSVNGKTMAELLANTKTHTAYLRRFVDVVEMWECEWKGKRIESDTKRFIDVEFPRRSTRRMTQHQILAAVVDGTLFGKVECDVCVPRELQDHFAEMQPIFKNATVTHNDIGPSCEITPKSTTSCQRRVACSWVVTVATRYCFPRPYCSGTSCMDLLWITCTKL